MGKKIAGLNKTEQFMPLRDTSPHLISDQGNCFSQDDIGFVIHDFTEKFIGHHTLHQ